MADPSKTEPATPKKKREAREGGQIARSLEVNTFVIFLLFLIAFRATAKNMLHAFQQISQHYLAHLGAFQWAPDTLVSNTTFLLVQIFYILLPILLATAIGGLAAGLAQAGLIISFKPIMPKWSKINPVTGLQRIFSMQGLAELFRSTIKIVVVGWVVYETVARRFGQLLLLSDMNLKQGLFLISDITYQIIFRVLIVLAIIAVVDFLYQRWQFEQNLKMTKDEVKEEMKQLEGDPRNRGRIRSKQRQMAMRRMMQEVPKAVVVVTNPVHLALALEYKEEMPAPRLLAKGAGFVAERIKEIARENKIPIVEKPPLAQALYKSVDLGRFIPPDLYLAVAEIIAYVYQLKSPARMQQG